uniref:Uncharacterized protein n=1 Tax=Coccidioides posadasii RMSCC 3488 TaxID=454284 RepID=A0A0J6IM09_COCPO|nr:hypothetical protein CPAG_09262 [Coccidioides posadasii RMSCC 3488]
MTAQNSSTRTLVLNTGNYELQRNRFVRHVSALSIQLVRKMNHETTAEATKMNFRSVQIAEMIVPGNNFVDDDRTGFVTDFQAQPLKLDLEGKDVTIPFPKSSSRGVHRTSPSGLRSQDYMVVLNSPSTYRGYLIAQQIRTRQQDIKLKSQHGGCSAHPSCQGSEGFPSPFSLEEAFHAFKFRL